MKKIEFLYFEGCPSYNKALENLKAALVEENIEAEVELIHVDSPEEAEKFGFYGSPSIRVDGVDLEGKRGEYSYSCRIYEIDSLSTGIPTKEFIREKLNEYRIVS